MTLQWLLVAAVALFAVAYLAWKSWRAWTAGCGKGCGCAAPAPAQPPLITADDLMSRVRGRRVR